MRRLTGIIVCLVFFFCVSTIYAAPVGNIATPAVLKKGLVIQGQEGQYAIIATSENDITYDRNLENQDADTQFLFFGGKLGLMFMDRYIIYGVLGSGQASQKFQFTNLKVKWDTDYDFVWAVGGTVMAYETELEQMWKGILRIGLDGRYRQAHLDVDDPNQAPNYEFEEWQVALAVSYQIDQFIPYAGVKYSDATGDATATIAGSEYKIDFENDDNVGIFVGGDYLIDDSVMINIEGRFIDETAISAGATIRF